MKSDWSRHRYCAESHFDKDVSDGLISPPFSRLEHISGRIFFSFLRLTATSGITNFQNLSEVLSHVNGTSVSKKLKALSQNQHQSCWPCSETTGHIHVLFVWILKFAPDSQHLSGKKAYFLKIGFDSFLFIYFSTCHSGHSVSRCQKRLKQEQVHFIILLR